MDDREKELPSDIVNAGIYLFSTEFYQEFESQELMKDELKMIE